MSQRSGGRCPEGVPFLRPDCEPTVSTARIPSTPLTGPVGRLLTAYARRTWGQVPDSAGVYWHHRPLMRSVFGFERRVARWDRLDPTLKTCAVLASAGVVGCSWCLDFGSFLAHTEGLDEGKVREIPRWRGSDVFSPLERDVMTWAEDMTATPPTVTDELAERLLAQLGPAAMVELTQVVALENMRSRFNTAVGLTSQGFSAVCELPLADRVTEASG